MAKRRQGKINITYQALAELLGLPEGILIAEFDIDRIRNTIGIIVAPTSQDGAMPMPIDPSLKRLIFDIAEGNDVPTSEMVFTSDLHISAMHMAIYEKVRNLLVGTIDEDDPIGPPDGSCSCSKPDKFVCLMHAGTEYDPAYNNA